MDNLEKNLSNLPKPRLSKKADFKIKFKIYTFILRSKLQKLGYIFFRPYSMLAKVSYATLLVVIVLGSTAVYAANNDNITPGHSFYPLKKTIENVEENLSFTKNAQVDTLNKMSERRLKEALNMAQENIEVEDTSSQGENNSNIKQSLDEVVGNLEEAIATSKEISNTKSAKKAKEAIKKKNKDIIQYLDNIGDMAKKNQDEGVINKINEAKEAINKYNDDLDEDSGKDSKKYDSFIENRRDKNIDKQNEDSDKDSEDRNSNNESDQDNRQDRENND